MCVPAMIAALGPVFGGATAAGATAAAGAGAAAAGGGLAATLQTIGTLAAVGGSIASAVGGVKAGKAQARAIEAQMKTEGQLSAIEEARRRREFLVGLSQQRAELAARGVNLDSPTAIALGQTTAREMSFDSQAIRSGGMARQTELSAAQRAAKAEGMMSLLKGSFSAAGSLLSAAPDLWPGLRNQGVA